MIEDDIRIIKERTEMMMAAIKRMETRINDVDSGVTVCFDILRERNQLKDRKDKEKAIKDTLVG